MTDDRKSDLKEAVEGLEGEVYVYEGVGDLVRQLARRDDIIRNSVVSLGIQRRVDGSPWWALALGLTYVLVGGWLRYFDTAWRLPVFDFRGVIYRPYLQLHLPTLGGVIFLFGTLGIRRVPKSLGSVRLQSKRREAILYLLKIETRTRRGGPTGYRA